MDEFNATGAGVSPGKARRPYWHPVFNVTDCDTAVGKVTENGGSVQMGPEDVEGIGRLAICLDPSNADFAAFTPARS